MSQDWAEIVEKLTQSYVALNHVGQIQYAYNPRELRFQRDRVKLYHYQATKQKIHSTPVLVVFATVNRPEILDLFPDRSFIRGLLDNGLDVYLLDWGYPETSDSEQGMGDYVGYIHDCVNAILEKSNIKKINVIGICQGGLLSLCASALYKNIKNLVLISTPIDFQTKDNVIYQWIKSIDTATMLKVAGNIPGSVLTQFFISLRPFELVGKKYLRFSNKVSDEAWAKQFLQVEKWLHDAPDQTKASFFNLISDFYQENKLVKDEIIFHDKQIKLSDINLPVLNIVASDDEIIPPSASIALEQYIGSVDYTLKRFPSGHIGIYVSEKVGKKLPNTIATWLKER